MPHFICRWPGGDVLLASVESRQELDAILQERCEPGVCKVARYHGPLVLELKPDIPGVPRASAERFKLAPACPAFQAAWQTRLSSGDTDLLAADGSRQRVHRLVLQCRLPALQGQPLPAHTTQVRLPYVQEGSCLSSLVEYLYLDDVQQPAALTASLHLAALQCSLQRLVTRCEAHFAHQLEVQLLSWPVLGEAQREGVLDSFIGWAVNAEQLDRQELLQLCVHALARHYVAAQSRPTWSSLSPCTAALVQLVAASTAPPIIHRQVLPNGSAILPVVSNQPGDSTSNPSAATTAAAAAGPGSAQLAATPAGVVSADAEAFAAAGGRMTSWEWQQLQCFREAVAESRGVPEASPLLLEPQQLATNSLAGQDPGVSFAVKQAVLTPHKRLMDSVCRFAFPATHALLAAGWQLQAKVQQPPAGSATSAPAPADMAGVVGRGLVASVAQPAAEVVQPTQQPQPVEQQSQQQQQPTLGVQLPVPVPVLHQLQHAGHQAMRVQEPLAVEDRQPQQGVRSDFASDNGSCAGTPQHPSTQHIQPAAKEQPEEGAAQPGLGSTYCGATAGVMQTAPVGATNWPAGSHLQLRAQAAAGAAAQRLNMGHGCPPPLQDNPQTSASWGSAVAASSQPPSNQQPPEHQCSPQQQGLVQHSSAAHSWGTGVSSQKPNSSSGRCHSASTATGLTAGAMTQLCQQQSPADNAGTGLQAAAQGQGGLHEGSTSPAGDRLQPWLSECGGFGSAAGSSSQEQPVGQQQAAPTQLEGAGSIAAAQEPEGCNLSWGSYSLAGAMQSQTTQQGCVDLPSVWQQPPKATTRGAGPRALLSSAAEQKHRAASMADEAAAGAPAPAQGGAGARQQTAVPGGTVPLAAPAQGPGRSSSQGSSACPQPLAALQRALVDDFVLYEEASAARQHVVGILVAVEQGDAAAGQRLLAPACAELITATAPAAVPNRLAGHLNVPAVVSAAAAATSAGLPAAEVSAAVAVAAAEEHCRSVQGINRLLGSAASSRAALEVSPKQLKQQRAQQQQLLLRALQQVSTRVPWLSRLLTPLQHTLGANTAEGEGPLPAADRVPAPASAAAAPPSVVQHTTPTAEQRQHSQVQHQQQPAAAATVAAASDGVTQEAAAAADAAAGQDELQSAVVELIMQLPELLHGLPGPALLTLEQYKQRHTQAQQLAAHAMQLLLPPATGTTDADGGSSTPAAAAPPADGVAAELAASGLLAAASAAMAASQTTAPLTDPAGSPGGQQHHTFAGHLFANILDSLRAPGLSGAANQPPEGAAGAAAAVAAAEAALSAAYGVRAAGSAAGGFLSRTAAFAAANRLSEGLIRPPSSMPASSLGLSRAGSLAGAGQLGAWRLTAGAGAAAGALMTPGSMAGALGMGGAFAPTGTGALLSGGLLAEGGVAGDSILDDMLHGSVRRITCHGLYELCAALAQPAGGVGSPPAAGTQPQQQAGDGLSDGPAAVSEMETDDSSRSTEGRARTGQNVAEAVATVAAAAATIESSRRSSISSMGPPAAGGSLSGTKRRLSSTVEEAARPLKH